MVEGEFGSSLFCNPSSSFFCVWESVSLRLGKEALFLFFPWAQFHFYCAGRERRGEGLFSGLRREQLFLGLEIG